MNQFTCHEQNDPVEWQHLLRIIETHPARLVCEKIGVSKSMMSQVLHGARMSPNFRKRLFSQFALPAAAEPKVQRDGIGKQNSEAVWLNMATGQAVDLTRTAEDSLDALDEVDRLVLSSSYQSIRAVALGFDSQLASVLLEPPSEGPSVSLAAAQASLRALIDESEVRQQKIDGTVSSELWRRHSQFREQLRRKLDRLATVGEIGDLAKCAAWRATVRALSALLRTATATRLALVDELRKGDELSKNLAEHLDRIRAITFPCPQYRNDPVGFVRDILGEEPWHVEEQDSQITFLEAVRDNKRVVVPAGRDTGKTKAVSWLCWWWYSIWDDGRVCISNFTGNQLRTQDWAEILRCHAKSGVCLDCRRAGVKQAPCPHSQVLDVDKPAEIPTTGIWSDDKERFIVGITGKEATALGGYHGEHLLVICDEGSGLTQAMYDAWRGNVSGPECRFVLPGNVLDGPGSPMHDAVTDDRVRTMWGWKVVNLNGEVAASTGLPFLPDLAELKILEMEDDRGRENPLYMVNVLGKYPTLDEQCVYNLGSIIKAQLPENFASTKAEGVLIISIDPAGESGIGDEAAMGAVRGLVVLEKKVGRGWSLEDYLDNAIELIERHRTSPNEQAIVAIDADGVGGKVVVRLDNYLASKRLGSHEKVRFEIVPVYFGQNAPDCFKYDLVGDEAHAHLARWLKHGGVFHEDHKLQQEMQVTKWYPVRRTRDERQIEVLSATRKDGPNGYRKIIHRSPDRLDMLRVFAYAAYMRDALAVPDETAQAAKEDEASVDDFETINEVDAFHASIRRLRSGQFG